jgi:nucleoside-diphosphate-sugar epimerase
MKRVLVAGASGFVGSALVRRLLSDGHDVHILLRTTSRTWRIDDMLPKVTTAYCDLTDTDSLKALASAIKPHWIFNCVGSGIASFRRAEKDILRSDFEGAVNLVKACLPQGFEAFVHSGSSTEYGFKDHAPAEAESCEPNSPHASAKARATAFHSELGRANAAPIVTLRLYTVYGPFESPRRLIPRCVAFGLANTLPPLAQPSLAHDFVHVDDVVNSYVLAALKAQRAPGAVYNIGTGRQSSLREVVEIIRATMGITAEPSWGSMPDRPYDTPIWKADVSLAETQLGWKPAETLEGGIRRFIEWLKGSDSLAELYVRESGEAW